jgi:hypothetical protein
LRPVDDLAGHRTDVDDHSAAARHHARPEDLAAVPDAGQVDVDDVAPLRLGDLEGRPVDAGARVVDQDVDGPELGADPLVRLGERCPVRHVGRERGGVDAYPR